MRWNVEGADGTTGEEHVYTFEAADGKEAEFIARKRGILVSAVYPSTIHAEQDKLDAPAEAAMSRTVRVGPPPAPAPSAEAPPIPYLAPVTTLAHAPDYFGLRFGAGVLMVFAVLYYLAAILTLVGALLTFGAGASQSQFAAGTVGAFGMVLASLTLGMVGGLLHALSAACVALRDIARNSFSR